MTRLVRLYVFGFLVALLDTRNGTMVATEAAELEYFNMRQALPPELLCCMLQRGCTLGRLMRPGWCWACLTS